MPAIPDEFFTSLAGSFGHSQGATGALNAQIKSAGLIKTVIPIEIPAQIWCSSGINCADTSKMTSGSIFLIDGSADGIISPETQLPWVAGEQPIDGYYKAVPNNIVKLKGSLEGPNHNDVTGQPGCAPGAVGCERRLGIPGLSDRLVHVSTSGRQLRAWRLHQPNLRDVFRKQELGTRCEQRNLAGPDDPISAIRSQRSGPPLEWQIVVTAFA
jgi:hypothetical protein